MAKARIVVTLVAAAAASFSVEATAAGGGSQFNEPANNDVGNEASLQRGARNYMNYCAGCHSAKYVRYNTLADGLELSEEQLIENLMFNAEKTHETIRASMPADQSARWFGKTPPDLSLIARSRGTDYLYNFLRTFYVDDSRPTGTNNMVLAAASMPHVLWKLQGLQRPVYEEVTDEKGHTVQQFVEFEQVTEGTLSPEEYDQFVRDTVNFLDYISEPVQLERRVLGVWVLLFLVVFFLFAYLLKKEIWKDVH
ncbi:cytochrome c1 [Lentisalinibacter salinarum]|uniref:cytochrome c1 n=1 Tax=Lentisalinibacter salinarum TaxID=2992239 RepID=UPI0038669E0F